MRFELLQFELLQVACAMDHTHHLDSIFKAAKDNHISTDRKYVRAWVDVWSRGAYACVPGEHFEL